MLYQTTLYIYSYVGNVEKDQVGNMLGWFVLGNRRTNYFLKSKSFLNATEFKIERGGAQRAKIAEKVHKLSLVFNVINFKINWFNASI
jgi:hypothetical protein